MGLIESPLFPNLLNSATEQKCIKLDRGVSQADFVELCSACCQHIGLAATLPTWKFFSNVLVTQSPANHLHYSYNVFLVTVDQQSLSNNLTGECMFFSTSPALEEAHSAFWDRLLKTTELKVSLSGVSSHKTTIICFRTATKKQKILPLFCDLSPHFTFLCSLLMQNEFTHACVSPQVKKKKIFKPFWIENECSVHPTCPLNLPGMDCSAPMFESVELKTKK